MAYELWPKPIANEIRRLQGMEDLASWELFPSSLQEMVAWADVYKDEEKRDKSRNNILIYKNIPEEDKSLIFPVAIRMHGILEQFRIERFGNWTGKSEDVLQAVQYINLSSGGHEAPWNATISSLNLACDYVSRKLSIPMQEMPKTRQIYLQRRVFYKRETARESKESLLTQDEDPEGKFYHIQEWWSVARPLRVAELTADGKKMAMNSIMLTEGDFVEVGAELDFVVNKNRNTQITVKCFLTCTYIVRLMPAIHVQNAQLDIKRATWKHDLGDTETDINRGINSSSVTTLSTMVKTKNDAVPDKQNTTETRPNKKVRIDDAEISGEDAENVQTGDDATAGTMRTSDPKSKSVGSSKEPMTDLGQTVAGHETANTDALPTTSKHGGGACQPTLTVKTVIPHPTKQLIENSEVEEYDDTLKLRLQKLSEYTNSNANIYALSKLLPTATWGPYRAVNNRSKVLCDPATGDPLTIWAVGCIAKMWFMRQGKPESQASITILPLSQTLAKQSGQLLTKFSNPVLNLNQQKIDIIRAMKWQNAKGGDSMSEPILFDSVYDAREEGSLKTYSDRPVWSLTDLKAGDLILLEMKMTHYSRRGEDNKWQSRAQYEMIAISLLHMAEMPDDDEEKMHHIDGLAI
ncbi:hypothetical protein EV424DRAFT_1355940 [Suillus variegatus]|nr:hypothetical protein EV424DRAFT_1355940 [Suillus variegatus]